MRDTISTDELNRLVREARRDEREYIARWLEQGAGEKESHWNRVYARKIRESLKLAPHEAAR